MRKAIVFAGQGAQFVGMGKDLAEAFPACKALYARADEVLGYALADLCFEGPIETLTKSNHCQPAIFVTSIACYTALVERLPTLDVVATAGLSLGEWSALHMAGVLSFEDTLKILEARGRFMQEACEERGGGMVSVIGLERAQVEEVCTQTGCELANLNSPGQIVLSGENAAVAAAAAAATALGAKRAVVLPVAGAFHSSLMASAAPRLEKVLAGVTFNPPLIPVVANVTGQPHGSVDNLRQDMIRQVTGAVHWYEGIEWMTGAGVDAFIECGPGRVLTGLIKRIAPGATLCNVQDVPGLDKTVAALA
jgi:[acyl-carrier-protein] S-malonyltransferase